MYPTKEGTTMPGMVAKVFEMPMSVPAKGGAMSMWLERKPEYIPPMNMVPRVSRATARSVLQPTYVTEIRQMAGGMEAAGRVKWISDGGLTTRRVVGLGCSLITLMSPKSADYRSVFF